MKQDKGKPILAETLHRLPTGVEALASRVSGPGLRGGDLAGLPLRSLVEPARALVRLTGTGPYGGVEVEPVAGGGWVDLINGRTLAIGTIREDNGLVNLTGKKVEVELTKEGDWRFAYPRACCDDPGPGPPCESIVTFRAWECERDPVTLERVPYEGATLSLWRTDVVPAEQLASCTTGAAGECDLPAVELPIGTPIEWRVNTALYGVCVYPAIWTCPELYIWSPSTFTDFACAMAGNWGNTLTAGTPWGNVVLDRGTFGGGPIGGGGNFPTTMNRFRAVVYHPTGVSTNCEGLGQLGCRTCAGYHIIEIVVVFTSRCTIECTVAFSVTVCDGSEPADPCSYASVFPVGPLSIPRYQFDLPPGSFVCCPDGPPDGPGVWPLGPIAQCSDTDEVVATCAVCDDPDVNIIFSFDMPIYGSFEIGIGRTPSP